MSRPYGRRPPASRKQPEPPATEIQVNLAERHTMEQLALEVQRALALVQDYGAFGVEKFRFRLLPLDENGVPMVLRNGQGQPVTVINIPEQPAAPPVYRANEPGVGVSQASPSSLASQDRAAPNSMHRRDK